MNITMNFSVESDRLGSYHTVGIPYTKDGGFGKPIVVCTDPVEDSGESNELVK